MTMTHEEAARQFADLLGGLSFRHEATHEWSSEFSFRPFNEGSRSHVAVQSRKQLAVAYRDFIADQSPTELAVNRWQYVPYTGADWKYVEDPAEIYLMTPIQLQSLATMWECNAGGTQYVFGDGAFVVFYQ